MNKFPSSKIQSLLSYDFTFKVDDDHEYTIPKGVNSASAEPKVVYNTNSIGAWKINADTTDKNYIASFERANRKKTSGLPAMEVATEDANNPDALPTKLLLVSAEVAAVGRKIEKRKDLVTPADLIRARYNNNRYIRFLLESAVPAN